MLSCDMIRRRKGSGRRMKKKSHGVCLADVAERAGVSLATASRVLSGSSYPVNPATVKKVFRAAEEVHYYPGPRSSVFSPEQSPIIAVIVPSLHNPFFNEVILGAEASATQKGFRIMVMSSHRSVEEERRSINSLLQTRITALMIISIDTSSETLEQYIKCGGRVALLESNFPLEHAIIANTDHLAAGRLATEYLLSCGHRNIAFFSSPLTKSYRRAILQGIRETMQEAELPFSERNLFIAKVENESDAGHYEYEMGKTLIQEFLPRRRDFTALIAINDLTALGMIQALTQKKIQVPEALSVVSFDNIPYSEMINPPLTTVELPSVSLAMTACNLLIDTFTGMGESLSGIAFGLKGKLVERASVRNLRML